MFGKTDTSDTDTHSNIHKFRSPLLHFYLLLFLKKDRERKKEREKEK